MPDYLIMQAARRIVRNTVWLLGRQLVTHAVTMVLGILIARGLGQAGYGLYALAFALAGMVGALSGLGLDTLVAREIARRREAAARILVSAAPVRVALDIGALAGIAAVAYAAGYAPYVRRLILLAGIVSTLNTGITFLRGAFQGLERMELDALSRIVERLVALICVGWVIWRGGDVTSVLWALLIAALTGLLATSLLARRTIRGEVAFSGVLTRRLFRNGLSIGVAAVAIATFQRVDTFILSLFRPSTDVGAYAAAVNLIQPFNLIPIAFATALLPLMARLFPQDAAQFRRVVERVLRYVFLVGLPVSVGLGLLADQAVLLVYGTEFQAASSIMQLLAPTVVIIFITTLLFNILIAVDRQTELAMAEVITLVVTVALGVILVPTYGTTGAAMTVMIRETCILLLQALAVFRIVGRVPVLRILTPPIAAAGLMAIVVTELQALPVALLIPAGAAMYLAGLWATGALTAEDVHITKAILRPLTTRLCRRIELER